jgi:hypothetical protein
MMLTQDSHINSILFLFSFPFGIFHSFLAFSLSLSMPVLSVEKRMRRKKREETFFDALIYSWGCFCVFDVFFFGFCFLDDE